MPPAPPSASSGDPFWLGRALVESGAITEEQLASAKRHWRRRPAEAFAAVLERLGLGEPAQLAALVGRRHGLPVAALGLAQLDRDAARLLPAPAARERCLVAFRRSGRALDVALADPAAVGPGGLARDFPGYVVRPHVAPRADILGWIEEAWRPPEEAAPDAASLFAAMLREAIAEGATDLHLEPRDQSLDVRQRIDGRLVHQRFVEQGAREAVIQAAKLAGRMDIAERRLPQDGRGAIAVGPRRYDLRFSCLPAVNGESVVVRIFDGQAGVRPLETSGLFAADLANLQRLLALPHGLVYVTGPTGSGKTTLLHAMLGGLPRREMNELKIVALEEPVEIRQPRFFLQIEVDERIGRSFGEVLRHALRHDPDVLLVGETRDAETAGTTLKAALTGHLCLSTLHTNDALGAIARLADLGLDPLMVACALKGVIAQRLLRRPCPRCRETHPQEARLRERYGGLLAGEGSLPEGAGFVAARPGRDCPECRGRGYRGRIAVIEVFPLAGLERLVAERAPAPAFLEPLRGLGCRTLFEDGMRKAALGLTTVEEVFGGIEEAPEPAPGACYHPSMPAASAPPPNRGDRLLAFTLVEIIAVLAVIAAVIAIGIPAIAKVLQSGRVRNVEGTASVVRSALTAYLSKPGSLGTIPVTESSATAPPVLPSSEWAGSASYDTAAASKAATLDNVLLAEGVLDRPISLRMGEQNFALAANAVPVVWSASAEAFSSSAAPTADYTAASRAEGAVSDGVSDPGVTGAAAGTASCAFNLAGNGVLIPAGGRVAYLIVKAVPDADAYQLALDVDGSGLVQNSASAPAAVDQTEGPVVYAKDPGTGVVDVYYYLMNL